MIIKKSQSSANPNINLRYIRLANIFTKPLRIHSLGGTTEEDYEFLRTLKNTSDSKLRNQITIILSFAPEDTFKIKKDPTIMKEITKEFLKETIESMPQQKTKKDSPKYKLTGEACFHYDAGKDATKTRPLYHVHINLCSIDINTLKVFTMSKKDMAIWHQVGNSIAERYGLKTLKAREKNKYKSEDVATRWLNTGHSWKLYLKEKMFDAYKDSNSFNEFKEKLKEHNILMREQKQNSNEQDNPEFIFSIKDDKGVHSCKGSKIDVLFAGKNLISHFEKTPNYDWKHDLHDRLFSAIKTADSLKEFASNLQSQGVASSFRREMTQLSFEDNEGIRRNCLGDDISNHYSFSNITNYFIKKEAGLDCFEDLVKFSPDYEEVENIIAESNSNNYSYDSSYTPYQTNLTDRFVNAITSILMSIDGNTPPAQAIQLHEYDPCEHCPAGKDSKACDNCKLTEREYGRERGGLSR